MMSLRKVEEEVSLQLETPLESLWAVKGKVWKGVKGLEGDICSKQGFQIFKVVKWYKPHVLE